jgi:C-methyltransferase
MWLSRAIAAAVELGLADAIPTDSSVAVADLAQNTGADADALRRLLRALAAHGIFVLHADLACEHTALSRVLRGDDPRSVRNITRLAGLDCMSQPWLRIADSMRSGRPAFEAVYGKGLWSYLLADDPEAAVVFQQGMTNLADATDGPLAASLAVDGSARWSTSAVAMAACSARSRSAIRR